MAITHSTAADGTFSAAGSTAWAAAHTVAAGTITEAMQVLADNTTGDVAITQHGYVPKAPNLTTQFLRGDATWAALPASSSTLNGITAATGAVTIASGNNTGIVWNWANTTDSTVAFTLGETSAATGGTSTSGVPNQVLCKLATVAASTQSPLSVYSRAAHVFSVSPTTSQIFATSGATSTPPYSFAAATTSGMFYDPGGVTFVRISLAGVNVVSASPESLRIRSGSATAPGLTDNNLATNTGLYWPATNTLGVCNVTDGEWARFLTRAVQFSSAKADTVAYAINSLKSRGTVAAPTVITTGDDLLTVSGWAYLGATNTYQEATRVTHDSTGTISDATNGIGGIIKFSTRKQGTDTAVAERFRVDDAGHLVSIAGTANTPTITAGGGTNPTIAGTDNAFTVTIGTGGTATSVEVTFATAFANAPISSAQSDTDILALKSTPLTTKVTISAATPFTAGSNIDCICMGRA